MKIYRSDGSYIENSEDTAFGWNVDEISFAECIFDNNQNTIRLEDISSNIKIEEAESAVDFHLNPEKPTKIENIDSKVPPKTQLASLIDPCCVESNMLLSVVHYAKYKNLKKDVDNLGDLSGSSKLKFLINNDVEQDIRQALNNYYENKDDKVLSLMMELILADTNSDLDSITDQSQNIESATTSGKDCGDGIFSSYKSESGNRSARLDIIGLSDLINRNIEKMCEETGDIHSKISEIKKSFQDDQVRVNSLIQNAQNLERNLRETKFLEDLLHLLNGDLDKVTKKKSPFRIFLSPSDQEEPNLIV